MPSKKVLAEKSRTVSELTAVFKKAQSIVFADYRGLSVQQDTQLRNNLRQAEVTYRVIKNTLSSRAFEAAGMTGVDEHLVGPTAIAYSLTDAVAPARVLREFADKNDKLKLKGGWLEGKVINAEVITSLARIPAKEVLHGQLVFGLISPIAKLAIVLNAIREKQESSSQDSAENSAADAIAAESAPADAPTAEPAATESAQPTE